MTNDDSSSPAMQMRPPHMVTILQPSLSHREVTSGPRKNIMPVAREPTQAKKTREIDSSLFNRLNSTFASFQIHELYNYTGTSLVRTPKGEINMSVLVRFSYV